MIKVALTVQSDHPQSLQVQPNWEKNLKKEIHFCSILHILGVRLRNKPEAEE